MDDQVKQFIQICRKWDGFFKEALDEATNRQNSRLSQEAAFYLLGILIGNLKIDSSVENKSLAEKYNEALIGQFHGSDQADKFRVIGDYSLIMAGVWWQSLLRKLVDVDYYINIGSRSYQKAGESGPRNLSDLFEELSENFNKLANILTEATQCIASAKMSNSDILRMYEVWLRTQNPFLESKLRSLGIDVVPGNVTKQ